MMRPKDVFVGLYYTGRKLTLFSVEMKNVGGALSSVTGYLSKRGVSIYSGFVSARPAEPKALFSFIAELPTPSDSPAQIAEELRKLDFVDEVRFKIGDVEGLISDTLHFPLLTMGERCITLKVETFGHILEKLYDTFGVGASVILYQMGVGAGAAEIRNFMSRYGLNGLKALKLALEERQAKGWCIPEILSIDAERGEAEIAARELFECLPFQGRELTPMSHFFRGYLEGMMCQFFGREVKVSETKCIAKGDVYCLFTCGPRG